MDWLNIHSSTLKSDEFISSEPIERATWLSILGWCCTQENGGVIKDAKDWKDRKWQQICGVAKEEVRQSPLLNWVGNDLHVLYYPLEAQATLEQQRGAGSTGGKVKSEKKAQAAKRNGAKGGRPKKTQAETQAEQDGKPKRNLSGTQAETQGKEREGKERESNEKKRERKDSPLKSPQGGNSSTDFLDLFFSLIPDPSPQFQSAWQSWASHRREIRKKLTPTSAKQQLQKLAAMSEPDAIAMIEHSISGGYQGLFEPKLPVPQQAKDEFEWSV